MWSRAELKRKAKFAVRRNYWKCVLVAFVLSILLIQGSGFKLDYNLGERQDTVGDIKNFVNNNFLDDPTTETWYPSDGELQLEETKVSDLLAQFLEMPVFLQTLLGVAAFPVMLTVALIWIAIGIFLINPVEVGGCRFFMENTMEAAQPGKLFYAFQNGNYTEVVITLFLRNLYIALWSLLLVIPGIIKSYEYRMVPYLLADTPEMRGEDAFRISKEMMRGEKWNAFILDLSFIGWNILNTFTLGILGIFYVAPYVNATNAELFAEFKRQYSDVRGSRYEF
ncbi:MAG: DUF975 family protein [Lachnospiraceae bacterium]|nr:DUF975 family protein [Lachnospiraceae bacterium]